MKREFIKNEHNQQLILIFAGWSTDAAFYSHIQLSGWDTLVVWDYSDFSFSEEWLDGYHTVALFAWSLGVYAAARSLPAEKITLAVAINGTENPVDDLFGIPVSLFNGTISNLNERNLLKFRKRMAEESFSHLSGKFRRFDDVDSLRRELENIAEDSSKTGYKDSTLKWQSVFVASRDKIFPPSSQLRAWKRNSSNPRIIEIDSTHYLDLMPIVSALLPSKKRIGARFEKSHTSYNSQASAQRHIAMELMRATAEFIGEKNLKRAAEIGAGTGFFTKLFSEFYSPNEMDIIDLYPIPPFRFSALENYYVADAEQWMEERVRNGEMGYDAIVASSAIQWFSNPDRFIENASRLLKPDGFIALSTFLPGNLAELENVNPYSLPYRGRDEMEIMVRKRFSESFFQEERIELNFDSPRQLLRHLRQTGVGGNGSSPLSLKDLLHHLPSTLTYLPFYIIGYKPRNTISNHQS